MDGGAALRNVSDVILVVLHEDEEDSYASKEAVEVGSDMTTAEDRNECLFQKAFHQISWKFRVEEAELIWEGCSVVETQEVSVSFSP